MYRTLRDERLSLAGEPRPMIEPGLSDCESDALTTTQLLAATVDFRKYKFYNSHAHNGGLTPSGFTNVVRIGASGPYL